MAMTELELVNAITTRWSERQIPDFEHPVGLFITKMQSYLANLLALDVVETPGVTSFNMLWIMAYNWGILFWKYIPESSDEDTNLSFESLATLPLDISGVNWTLLKEEDYVMMASTLIRVLSDAWAYDTDTLWSTDSLDAARHLFQVCDQYLTLYGVAE